MSSSPQPPNAVHSLPEHSPRAHAHVGGNRRTAASRNRARSSSGASANNATAGGAERYTAQSPRLPRRSPRGAVGANSPRMLGRIQPTIPRKPRGVVDSGAVGPGSYYSDADSSIGKQHVSKRTTLPSFGFGTASRSPHKLYLSAQHAANEPRLESQDATTCNTRSALGKQPDSRKVTAPAASFGTSPRFGKRIFLGRGHAAVDQVGVDSPGAVYKPFTQFVKHRKGRKRGGRGQRAVGTSAPAFSFGVGKRPAHLNSPRLAKGARMPGPGSHNLPGGIASNATKKRGRGVVFGKDQRGKQVSIMRGGEGALLGTHSPGPGTYFTAPVVAAKRRHGPSHGFGDYTTPTYTDPLKKRPTPPPGPDHYNVTPRLGDDQPLSTMPNNGTTKFGKSSKDANFASAAHYVPGPGTYNPKSPRPGFVASPAVDLSDLAQPSEGGFSFSLAPRV